MTSPKASALGLRGLPSPAPFARSPTPSGPRHSTLDGGQTDDHLPFDDLAEREVKGFLLSVPGGQLRLPLRKVAESLRDLSTTEGLPESHTVRQIARGLNNPSLLPSWLRRVPLVQQLLQALTKPPPKPQPLTPTSCFSTSMAQLPFDAEDEAEPIPMDISPPPSPPLEPMENRLSPPPRRSLRRNRPTPPFLKVFSGVMISEVGPVRGEEIGSARPTPYERAPSPWIAHRLCRQSSRSSTSSSSTCARSLRTVSPQSSFESLRSLADEEQAAVTLLQLSSSSSLAPSRNSTSAGSFEWMTSSFGCLSSLTISTVPATPEPASPIAKSIKLSIAPPPAPPPPPPTKAWKTPQAALTCRRRSQGAHQRHRVASATGGLSPQATTTRAEGEKRAGGEGVHAVEDEVASWLEAVGGTMSPGSTPMG